jgi:hypothetical protein
MFFDPGLDGIYDMHNVYDSTLGEDVSPRSSWCWMKT